MAAPRIRFMTPEDSEAVHRVARLCFGNASVGPSELRDRLESVWFNGLVTVVDDWVIGYLTYTISLRLKTVLLHELGVLPTHRRRKVATNLFLHLFHLHENRSTFPFLAKVPEANLPFQLFLRSLGFLCTHIEKDESSGEALYVFRRSPPEGP